MSYFQSPFCKKKFVVFLPNLKMDLRSDLSTNKKYVDHAVKLPEAGVLGGQHASLTQLQLVEIKF